MEKKISIQKKQSFLSGTNYSIGRNPWLINKKLDAMINVYATGRKAQKVWFLRPNYDQALDQPVRSNACAF